VAPGKGNEKGEGEREGKGEKGMAGEAGHPTFSDGLTPLPKITPKPHFGRPFNAKPIIQ